jgi:hypothetical protein
VEALFTVRPSRPRVLFPSLDAYVRLPGVGPKVSAMRAVTNKRSFIAKILVGHIVGKQEYASWMTVQHIRAFLG